MQRKGTPPDAKHDEVWRVSEAGRGTLARTLVRSTRTRARCLLYQRVFETALAPRPSQLAGRGCGTGDTARLAPRLASLPGPGKQRTPSDRRVVNSSQPGHQSDALIASAATSLGRIRNGVSPGVTWNGLSLDTVLVPPLADSGLSSVPPSPYFAGLPHCVSAPHHLDGPRGDGRWRPRWSPVAPPVQVYCTRKTPMTATSIAGGARHCGCLRVRGMLRVPRESPS